MIVDSSALIAILRAEPGNEAFADSMADADRVAMSAASYLEAGMVIDRQGSPMARRYLDELIRMLDIEIVPFTEDQARIARQAFIDFGKGSGHPAQLNFGDCMTYALAVERCEPLLFKGADFLRTDLQPAL